MKTTGRSGAAARGARSSLFSLQLKLRLSPDLPGTVGMNCRLKFNFISRGPSHVCCLSTNWRCRVSGPTRPALSSPAMYTVHLSHVQIVSIILIPLVAQRQYRPTCTEALCSRLLCGDCGCCSWCHTSSQVLFILQLLCFHEIIMGCFYSDGGRGGGVSVDVHVVYFWLHSVQGNTYLVLSSWYRSNKGPVLHNVHLYNLQQ